MYDTYLHMIALDQMYAFINLPYKPVKVQNVRARFRAKSGFLDYDGVATNTMGLPDSVATNVLLLDLKVIILVFVYHVTC